MASRVPLPPALFRDSFLPSGYAPFNVAVLGDAVYVAYAKQDAEGTDEVAALLERLVDTTTACAVHLDDTGRLTPRHRERLAELLAELAARTQRVGLPATPPVLPMAV